MKLDPHLIPYTKISSRGIKDGNIKGKTLKFLEANAEQCLCDPGVERNRHNKVTKTKGQSCNETFFRKKGITSGRTSIEKMANFISNLGNAN